MEIKYIAHSSFIIKTKTATIVTDPFAAEIGIKFPKIEADIVTISHDHSDHNQSSLVDGNPKVFSWPGEFEVKGVSIIGISSFHDDEKGAKRGPNNMYKFSVEGMNLFHCGDLGHPLDDKSLEAIGAVDILFIPVGGTYTIDSTKASQIAKRIDPSIIIPMHFANPKLNRKSFSELESADSFAKIFGGSNVEKLPKLVIKREDVIAETATKVVILESTV